ncbi:hypothetical protein NKG95_30940 [Mesorhizobium sp. M1423]|uniref:hypothetical protein n=1 Tax=Mesorhizobium sp. M1423 TaxID=2957101 RepID=UPI003336EE18
MTVLAYSLAADAKGTWRLVFVPDDLHLYVEFSRPNAESNPVNWLNVDDFFAWQSTPNRSSVAKLRLRIRRPVRDWKRQEGRGRG